MGEELRQRLLGLVSDEAYNPLKKEELAMIFDIHHTDTHRPGGDTKTCRVSDQCRGDGIPGLFDTCGAEIDAYGVKCCFCGAKHHCCGQTYTRVNTVFGHQLTSYRQRGTAGDRADQDQKYCFRRDTDRGE